MRASGLALALLVACGKVADTGNDASNDADVVAPDASETRDWNDCDAGLNLGYACTSNADCCSLNCVVGSCQRPSCTSEGAACSGNVECCSGHCTQGVCTSLTTACHELGNACTHDGECCSAVCRGGVCVQASFCGQTGDVCMKGHDCCIGTCARAQPSDGLGTCSPPSPAGPCTITGIRCGLSLDGGPPPDCGGACCSRNCVPWGPFQLPVCVPPSGCRTVGDICHEDADCCGGTTQVCLLASPDAGSGICSNPTGCKPNGDICRYANLQCNGTDACCSGLVTTADTCQLDINDTPRCSVPRDGGTCLNAGASCMTSSDCCNRAPCVSNGSGLACAASACVPSGAACTTDGDCCVGTQCYFTATSTTGTCRALGTTCAVHGQICSASSDCCGGVPCTSGRCVW